MHDANEELVGHNKPLQLKFSVVIEFPLMHYKMHPMDKEWLPEAGIEMWKKNQDGSPKLPTGEPHVLPRMSHIKDVELVIEGLKKYKAFWIKSKDTCRHESTFFNNIGPIIEYWDTIIKRLREPSTPEMRLQKEFWPLTKWKDSLIKENQTFQNDRVDHLEPHYCGPRNARTRPEFRPHMDIEEGMFLLIRPYDENQCPVWLGSAASSINTHEGHVNYMHVLVDWWEPISRKRQSIESQYRDCWEKKWRRNHNDPSRWESVFTVLWSWRASKDPSAINHLKIPQIAINAAKENLQKKKLR